MTWKSCVRAALAGVLLVVVAAGAAAECISGVTVISQAGDKPNRVAGPIAWSGNVLAVAKDEPSKGDAVWIAIYDEYFNQLTPDILAAADSFDGPRHLFWTGTEFGIVWMDKSKRPLLQRFTEGGQLLGAAVRVTPETPFYGSDELDMTWSAARGAYVVAHRVTQGPGVGIYLGLMEKNGTTRINQLVNISPAEPARPRAVAADDGVVGIFFNHEKGTLNLTRVELDDRPRSSITIADEPGERIAIASQGNRFGIAKSVVTTASTTEIRWSIVNSSGVTVVSDRLLVTGSGVDVAPLSLSYANGEWVLAYADSKKGFLDNPGKLRLRRFKDDGTVISDSPMALESLRENALTQVPVLWTGSSHIASVARPATSRGVDSYLIRRCPVIAEINAERKYVGRDQLTGFNAVASGGQPPYSYRWDFGDSTPVATGTIERHRWKKPGTYTITLTVTDSTGATGKTTFTIVVTGDKRRSVRK